MKKLIILLMASVGFVSLTACESMTPAQSGFIGALGGGIAFGALGASIGAKGSTGHTVATIAGAGFGAMAGHNIGTALGHFNKNNSQNNKAQISPEALTFSFSLSGQAKKPAVFIKKPQKKLSSQPLCLQENLGCG